MTRAAGSRPLLADTELREDTAEQVVRCEFARDLGERVLGGTQLLGQQFPGAGRCQRLASGLEAGPGSLDRVEVATARRCTW